MVMVKAAVWRLMMAPKASDSVKAIVNAPLSAEKPKAASIKQQRDQTDDNGKTNSQNEISSLANDAVMSASNSVLPNSNNNNTDERHRVL